MDKREMLKSMLNNLINDKPEEASMDFHNYITPKTREVAGIVHEDILNEGSRMSGKFPTDSNIAILRNSSDQSPPDFKSTGWKERGSISKFLDETELNIVGKKAYGEDDSGEEAGWAFFVYTKGTVGSNEIKEALKKRLTEKKFEHVKYG